MIKLTRPQRRILENAVRNGQYEVGGRNMAAVDNLKAKGLITCAWRIQEAGIGQRWVGIVKPTLTGVELVNG